MVESKHARTKKLDNRLNSEHDLYCEGSRKPHLRGCLHLLYAILLIMYPPSYFYMTSMEREPTCFDGKMSGSIFAVAKVLCYGVSALYHIGGGWWSPSVEILLQKLDHCFIAAHAAANLLPMATLLLEDPIKSLFQIVLTVLCVHSVVRIFQKKPSTLRYARTFTCDK